MASSLRACDGKRAEDVVREYLRSNGWSIVATNLRLGMLELDIVARKGRVVAVVEVRTRGSGSWSSALGSIGPTKRRRVRSAGARLWNIRYRHDPTIDHLRYDAAGVNFAPDGTYTIDYVVAAF